jgi:HD-like signal output (HDOD) protein/ActR/RegA family two-component response regulator
MMNPKKAILFVDDESAVLQGLESVMRVERKRWESLFAQDAQAALMVLANQQIDVVVSDIKMPGMDGHSLLQKIRDEYPDTVRIVLTGYNELDAEIPPAPLAHQRLAKPCTPSVLRGAIEWACNIQSMLSKESIRRGIGEIDSLPSLPGLYLRLTHAIEDPATSMKDIANIIRQDVSMSAKILQVVNSSFFGLSRKISSIENAVSYLGTNLIRNILLSLEVFGAFTKTSLPGGLSLELIQRHSLFAAKLVRYLSKDEEAFTAALLHEIGLLLLAARFSGTLEQSIQLTREKSCPLSTAERELIGVTHAEVGAYLLGLWGLPYSIVEAVANRGSEQAIKQPSITSVLSIVERFANYYVPLFPSTNNPLAIADFANFIQEQNLQQLAGIAAREARQMFMEEA